MCWDSAKHSAVTTSTNIQTPIRAVHARTHAQRHQAPFHSVPVPLSLYLYIPLSVCECECVCHRKEKETSYPCVRLAAFRHIYNFGRRCSVNHRTHTLARSLVLALHAQKGISIWPTQSLVCVSFRAPTHTNTSLRTTRLHQRRHHRSNSTHIVQPRVESKESEKKINQNRQQVRIIFSLFFLSHFAVQNWYSKRKGNRITPSPSLASYVHFFHRVFFLFETISFGFFLPWSGKYWIPFHFVSFRFSLFEKTASWMFWHSLH